MDLLRLSDLRETPWKNGGGVTREIARGFRQDRMLWRISRADVAQDGDFSAFPGLTRILTIVAGGGMTLIHPDGRLQARLWEPVRFDGALPIHARLDGDTVTDLNLMFATASCDGDVTLITGPTSVVCGADQVALHVVAGTPLVGDMALAAGDTAFRLAGTVLSLQPGEAALAVRVHGTDQSDDIRLVIADR